MNYEMDKFVAKCQFSDNSEAQKSKIVFKVSARPELVKLGRSLNYWDSKWAVIVVVDAEVLALSRPRRCRIFACGQRHFLWRL